MKKTLSIDQVQFEDSFLEENEDVLPNGFVCLYNMVKQDVVIKEKKELWPNVTFVFKTDGRVLFYD